MTATQTQIRRDTAANLASVIPASSEIGHDTTNNRLLVGDGSRLAGWPIPNFRDVRNSSYQFAAASGSANSLVLTNTTPALAYVAGMRQIFIAPFTNTGAMTVNVDTLGSRNIVDRNGNNLVSGSVVLNGIYEIVYSGTNFQIMGLTQQIDSPGSKLLAIGTSGANTIDFTSNITSTYHAYLFVLEKLIPQGNVQLRMRVRRAGQGSFDTGTSDYSSAYQSVTLAGSVTWNSAAAGLIALTDTLGGGDWQGVNGSVLAYGLGQSSVAAFHSTLSHSTGTGVTADMRRFNGFSQRGTTSALDGVRFYLTSGIFTSGTIYMYGLDSAL